ncbi:hypothetical protein K493DRAFT_8502 [Basidiobolus meristosporus CBS 931.73]|uniref:Uncharacterized protein n=1 Tax=Basidiobolus meristosporus CBS 931.73 TaxID=1314790 RepID=A0A1Y1YKG1_9FUNG|nr:hypothetical protein K493DRAFT_8502 [Basidiobolus meristosporus CBS 931.73]|eukprot:ORX98236.1 hypothetical protein K493DRAFT_8502 [Basidiobolus meristosporus CBS 931.73]
MRTDCLNIPSEGSVSSKQSQTKRHLWEWRLGWPMLASIAVTTLFCWLVMNNSRHLGNFPNRHQQI